MIDALHAISWMRTIVYLNGASNKDLNQRIDQDHTSTMVRVAN